MLRSVQLLQLMPVVLLVLLQLMELYQLPVAHLLKQEYLLPSMVAVTVQQHQELLAWLSAPSPPTIIIIPASVTLGCNPSASDITAALGSATATAACSTPIVTFTDGAVTSSGCYFSQVRTFTASDGCGNSATAIRTVNWTSDLIPPSITATGTCYNSWL
jgi:hypothetical protein